MSNEDDKLQMSALSPLDVEILELCTRKCIDLKELQKEEHVSVPQRSCFYRCGIKYKEAFAFTCDMLKFQSYEIATLTRQQAEEEAKVGNPAATNFLDKFNFLFAKPVSSE